MKWFFIERFSFTDSILLMLISNFIIDGMYTYAAMTLILFVVMTFIQYYTINIRG